MRLSPRDNANNVGVKEAPGERKWRGYWTPDELLKIERAYWGRGNIFHNTRSELKAAHLERHYGLKRPETIEREQDAKRHLDLMDVPRLSEVKTTRLPRYSDPDIEAIRNRLINEL